jgi:hypothetical protein
MGVEPPTNHVFPGISLDKLEFKTDGRVLGEASLEVDPHLKAGPHAALPPPVGHEWGGHSSLGVTVLAAALGQR